MSEMTNRIAYSVDEAATQSNLCRDKIYRAIREGNLRAVKAGRRTIIPAESLRQFIENLPPLQLPPAA